MSRNSYALWNVNLQQSSKNHMVITEIYKEDILNGADPVLKTELIPVIIDNDVIPEEIIESYFIWISRY